MAKRMDEHDTFYRVRYEVEYDIRYIKFNPDWDHTKPTTGDYEGDNPMYVYQDAEMTHEHFVVYLGPYGSQKTLERQAEDFEQGYRDSESYHNVRIQRGPVEKAKWEAV